MARYVSALAGLLLFSFLTLGGCGGTPEDPVVTRDSAGVAIIQSNQPAWSIDAGWYIDSEDPRMVVGGLVGQRPYEFTTVGDARLLDDGSLLVTHCSNPPELRLYGPDGAFRTTFGGPQEGPGQCNFILHNWIAGDTAILYDPSLGHLTYFPLTGGTPRQIDLDAAGMGDVEGGDPIWVSRFGDGTLLGRPNRPLPVENGRTRAPFYYVRLDPRTLTVDTLIRARGSEYVVEGLGTPQEDIRNVLFSPFTYALAHGSHFFLADSECFWIEERDMDGALLRRFGRGCDPVGIDRRFRRAYAEQQIAAASTSRRPEVRAELARAVFADHFPAHEGEMVMDGAGNLWVLHVRAPGDLDRAWSVFNPDGRWLGEVHVPLGLRVTDVGPDYVVGVWRDEDGVQSIRAFDLVKPGA